MADIVIENGWVVTPRETKCASIAVDGNRISKIAPQVDMPAADHTIDAAGKYVIPGLIDMHVHYGITGTEDYWKRIERDIEVETLAAAYGGMTTHYPMLAGNDALCFGGRGVDRLHQRTFLHQHVVRRDHPRGRAHRGDARVARDGHFDLQAFLHPYKNEIFDTLVFRPLNEGQMYRSFETIRDLGAPAVAMIHAEDNDLYEVFVDKAKGKGLDGLEGWAAGRPNICEYSRVELPACWRSRRMRRSTSST